MQTPDRCTFERCFTVKCIIMEYTADETKKDPGTNTVDSRNGMSYREDRQFRGRTTTYPPRFLSKMSPFVYWMSPKSYGLRVVSKSGSEGLGCQCPSVPLLVEGILLHIYISGRLWASWCGELLPMVTVRCDPFS